MESLPDTVLVTSDTGVNSSPNPSMVMGGKKRNSLASAHYNLSARAQKLALYAISLIDPNDHKLENLYTIDIEQFALWAGMDVRATQRDVMNAYESKADREAEQHRVKSKIGSQLADRNQPPRKPFGRELVSELLTIRNHPTGNGTLICNWFQSIYQDPNAPKGAPTKLIKIRWTTDLAPYLIDLNVEYYRVKVIEIQRMQSRFSLRLYEWLRSQFWIVRKQGRPHRFIVPLDELRGILGTDRPIQNETPSQDHKSKVGGRKYPTTFVTYGGQLYERKFERFASLKAYALDVAVREIIERTDMVVKCIPIRGALRGTAKRDAPRIHPTRHENRTKAVTHVTFELSDKAEAPSVGSTSVEGKNVLEFGDPTSPLPGFGSSTDVIEPPIILTPTSGAPDAGLAPPSPESVLPVAASQPEPVQKSPQEQLDATLLQIRTNLGLTDPQVASTLEYARTVGKCETANQIMDYLILHYHRTDKATVDNRAKHAPYFLAACKRNDQYGSPNNRKKFVDPRKSSNAPATSTNPAAGTGIKTPVNGATISPEDVPFSELPREVVQDKFSSMKGAVLGENRAAAHAAAKAKALLQAAAAAKASAGSAVEEDELD